MTLFACSKLLAHIKIQKFAPAWVGCCSAVVQMYLKGLFCTFFNAEASLLGAVCKLYASTWLACVHLSLG